jgi:hypothetical protein
MPLGPIELACRSHLSSGLDAWHNFPCPRDKAKKRVRAYTGDSQVRELQFRPGITPGLKGIIPLNDIAWRRSRALRQERNEIDRLGDFGLVERLRLQSRHMSRK